MKTGILILCVLLGARAGFARVKAVRADSYGRFRFTVESCGTRVAIDERGRIVWTDAYGSCDYFDCFDDPGKEGKPRRIGDTSLDYYGAFENSAKEGKLKRVCKVAFDYYETFDNSAKQGKIKRIGEATIDYYDTFDNPAKQGKVKRIGDIEVDYYDTLDGHYRKGKLKRIGDRKFDYSAAAPCDGPGAAAFETGGIRFRIGE